MTKTKIAKKAKQPKTSVQQTSKAQSSAKSGSKQISSDWKNKLICGDNLEMLVTMESESIDLIYIDPPFFSNRKYEIIWGDEAEIRSFDDRWEGGINVYVDWMKERIIELHRVLKSTGSFYLHCDWHAGHSLKLTCDEVFGSGNFQNEIVWYYRGGGISKERFGRRHDTIFFYTKSKKWTFNPDDIRTPYSAESLERLKYKARSFRGKKVYDNYEPNPLGKHPDDVWIMQPIMPSAKERLGYPTQKPETLLERIIMASSNKGDVVLDAYCDCGTAMAVAQKLGRRWIGIDISPSAIALVKIRFNNLGVHEKEIDIIGMPKKADDLKKFKPFDFQYWVINEMHGIPSPKKVGDLGIDGLSFLQHYPIQVKQSEKVGRPVIDNFETAIRRYYKNHKAEIRGLMVGFSFTKGAYEEVARAKKEGMTIDLITVQDILDKKFHARQLAGQLL